MTKQIDHGKLVDHARKLDSEARQWTERQLRSTSSSEHLSMRSQPRDTVVMDRRESAPVETKPSN